MEKDLRAHYAKINKVLIIILGLNWLVAGLKIIFGYVSSCQSMVADGWHSLADGASNIIGIVGIKFACQPVDEDHPYGHKKYETLFALGIAAMLFIVAFNLAKEGVIGFYRIHTPVVDIVNFSVMIITMIVNFAVVRYERSAGTQLKSDILLADAMHTKADMFTSFSVIAAFIGIKAGITWLDHAVCILISFFIAWAGFKIIKESSDVLCDTAVILDIEKIKSIVMEIKGVKACHKIRTRGRHDDIHIDLHVQVHPDMHIDNAHKICYAIEEALKQKIPEVSDVIVHIEPL